MALLAPLAPVLAPMALLAPLALVLPGLLAPLALGEVAHLYRPGLDGRPTYSHGREAGESVGTGTYLHRGQGAKSSTILPPPAKQPVRGRQASADYAGFNYDLLGAYDDVLDYFDAVGADFLKELEDGKFENHYNYEEASEMNPTETWSLAEKKSSIDRASEGQQNMLNEFLVLFNDTIPESKEQLFGIAELRQAGYLPLKAKPKDTEEDHEHLEEHEHDHEHNSTHSHDHDYEEEHLYYNTHTHNHKHDHYHEHNEMLSHEADHKHLHQHSHHHSGHGYAESHQAREDGYNNNVQEYIKQRKVKTRKAQLA